MVHTDEIVGRAAAAIRAGECAWGRELLSYALRRDPEHEQAWLWLSAVVQSAEEQRYCLGQALAANAESERARAGLAYLGEGMTCCPRDVAEPCAPTLTLLRPSPRPTLDGPVSRLLIPEPEPEPELPGSLALRSLVIVLLLTIMLVAALQVPGLVLLSL